MREYPLKVPLHDICLRNIVTYAYWFMLHNAGVFTSRLSLLTVKGMFEVPSTTAIHLN